MASTSGTAYITTASEEANELYESNRDYNNQLTWQSLYNANEQAAGAAQQQLNNQYAQANAEAYVASLQSKQALKNSNVVGAQREAAMSAYDTSLQNNLSDIKSSYASAQSDIEESRSEGEEYINNALMEQAEYSADYTNAHYDYLQYLYEDNPSLFESTLYKKYLGYDYQRDEEGNILKDDEGNYLIDEDSSHLKSWDELTTVTKDENGEYSSIYDENGNLTQFGIDFFDQMENSWDYVNNDYYGNTSDTWSQWLKENNEDLYDWASSYNYYNYTQAGTNAGTMRTQYGMMSTDMTYSYLERMGGMTSSQVNAYFDKVNSTVDKVNELCQGEDTNVKKLTSATNDMVDAMQQMTDDLGLTASMEAEGFSWDSMRESLNEMIQEGKDYTKEVTNQNLALIGDVATVLTSAIGGAAALGTAIDIATTAMTYTAVAAVNSSLVAATFAISPLLAVTGVGAIVVAAAAIGVAIWRAVEYRKERKEKALAISSNISDAMSQFAVSLVDYKHNITSNTQVSRNQIIY